MAPSCRVRCAASRQGVPPAAWWRLPGRGWLPQIPRACGPHAVAWAPRLPVWHEGAGDRGGTPQVDGLTPGNAPSRPR